jgi:hypothetical protein
MYKNYPLHYAHLLNKTLLYLKENSALSKDEVHTINRDEIPKPLFMQLIRHLEKHEYIFIEKNEKLSGGFNEQIYVSVYGLSFLEKGGFVNQYNAERAKYVWNIAKTIAATANAIIIILIAIYAVVVSNKSNQQEGQIRICQDSIIKLNKLIK